MKCHKCKESAVWVDHGPRLQWWYCRDCKVEVQEVTHPKLEEASKDDGMRWALPYWYGVDLSKIDVSGRISNTTKKPPPGDTI